jgi:hypothetical protein
MQAAPRQSRDFAHAAQDGPGADRPEQRRFRSGHLLIRIIATTVRSTWSGALRAGVHRLQASAAKQRRRRCDALYARGMILADR